jgi:hypothetical protein
VKRLNSNLPILWPTVCSNTHTSDALIYARVRILWANHFNCRRVKMRMVDKSSYRNVACGGSCRMAGCDFRTGRTIVLRPNVQAESRPRLKKWQGLTASISGQSVPPQPVSRPQAMQATISPTTHGHASYEARYQTRILGFRRRGYQEVSSYCLYITRINVKLTVARIVGAVVDSHSRGLQFPHSD